MDKNHMVVQALKSAAHLLTKLEDSSEDWHIAPIWGHTQLHKFFLFYGSQQS